ncbi:MAG: inositol monophosphatase family protein [Jatrophihabitans sp.]
MSDASELSGELAVLAVELAEGAARLIRAARGRALAVGVKSTPTDLVTDVDRAAESWLTEQIERRRPDDSILGEEGASRTGTSLVRWILDPIDGTVNFVLGLPQYAVSVAAELDGQVVAGAVINVATAEMFRACVDRGAFLGERRLDGPREVPLARAVVGTGFSYDAEVRRRQGAVVAALLPQVADIRRLGSAALDLCHVADGRLDAYFESGLHPWDYAAGALIAAEAGCRVSGPSAAAPSSRLVIASGASVATELADLLGVLGADVSS